MMQWTKAKAPSIFHQYPKFSTDGFCGWNLCLILSAQSTCMFYLTIDWLRVKTLKATIIPPPIFFYFGQTAYDMIVSIYKTSKGCSKILVYVYITLHHIYHPLTLNYGTCRTNYGFLVPFHWTRYMHGLPIFHGVYFNCTSPFVKFQWLSLRKLKKKCQTIFFYFVVK